MLNSPRENSTPTNVIKHALLVHTDPPEACLRIMASVGAHGFQNADDLRCWRDGDDLVLRACLANGAESAMDDWRLPAMPKDDWGLIEAGNAQWWECSEDGRVLAAFRLQLYVKLASHPNAAVTGSIPAAAALG